MLTAVIVLAIVPAFVILVLGIVARAVAAQRVTPRVVQYAPERGVTVLRDALLVNADRRAASAALIDLAVKRKVRLIAGATREPIGVEIEPNVVLTADELALLEALFGPEHTHGRVRRFSAIGARSAGGCSTLAAAHRARARARRARRRRRVAWPGMTLTILAYLGMLVEALFIVFALIDGDWPALIATLIALAATIATILVTPSSWRRFLPPARAKREHLEGLRQYLDLAEADRLRDAAVAERRRPACATDAATGREARPQADRPARPLPPARAAAPLRGALRPRTRVDREAASSSTPPSTASNLDTLADAVDVTAEVASALDAAGGVLELTAAVGDLVDAGGVGARRHRRHLRGVQP